MPYYSLAAPVKPIVKARPRPPILAWPTYDNGEWNWTITSYQNYVQEGYESNALIYSAIAYKQRAISQAPLRPFKGNFQQHEMVDLDHPAWNWCLRPNPNQSFVEFMQQGLCFLNLSGNVYIYLDYAPDGSLAAMYNLRPDWVELLFNSRREFQGYLYKPEHVSREKGVPIIPSRIIHVKLPNPRDPFGGDGYGMSPLMPVARPADVDNYVTKFLYQYFRSGVVALGAIKTKAVMNDADRAILRREWSEMFGGADDGWTRPMVFDEKLDWQPFTPPFKDLDFNVIDRRDEARITSVLGVHGMLLGLPGAMERSTFNNMKEAKADFWETTFLPELNLFEVEFIHYLTTDDGVFPMFDTSDVPALKRDMPPLVQAFTQLVGVGVPPVIAAETVALPMQRWEGDELSYRPLSLQPAGTPPPALPGQQPPAEEPTPPPAEDDNAMEDATDQEGQAQEEQAAPVVIDQKDWTPEQKAIIWKAQNALADSWQGAFADAAAAQLKRDHAEISALLKTHSEKSANKKAAVQWLDALPSVQEWMQAAGEDMWRNTFYPVQVALVGDIANFWSAEVGLAFDVLPIEGMLWFEQYTLKFAQPINATTSGNIHDLLQQGQAEGWSIPVMQKHLAQIFEQYLAGTLTPEEFAWFDSRMPAYRRELIARTETTRLANAGSHNLFREWGVTQKEWLATMDDRVRESHAAMHGQVRPINQPFDLPSGAQMMHPGDPAVPDEGYNCRCTELPKFNEKQAGMIGLKVKTLGEKHGASVG